MSSKHKKLEISPGTDYTLKSFPHAEQIQSEIQSSWQLGQALAEVADTANMCTTCRSPKISSRQLPTSSSLIATQLFEGNPWSIGTRNWRQPDQWPTKSIIQIKLKIRMNTEAMFRNWKAGFDPNERFDFWRDFKKMKIPLVGSSGRGCNIKRANKTKMNLWNNIS